MVAIDTSGPMSGLAIMHEGQLMAETTWMSERRHTEQVLAHLDVLCRLVAVTPAHITHIAVCIGPGSWSGIRVGISIAKGLAIANNAVIVGINALDVLAYAAPNHLPITAIIALGRGRFAAATYTPPWQPGQVTPHNYNGTELSIDAHHLLVCEPHVAPLLPPAIMHHSHQYHTWPHPRHLAILGQRAFQHHPNGYPHIEPMYLGEPVQPKV